MFKDPGSRGSNVSSQDMYEPRKKNNRLLSIESWLVNRDPYFMVY